MSQLACGRIRFLGRGGRHTGGVTYKAGRCARLALGARPGSRRESHRRCDLRGREMSQLGCGGVTYETEGELTAWGSCSS